MGGVSVVLPKHEQAGKDFDRLVQNELYTTETHVPWQTSAIWLHVRGSCNRWDRRAKIRLNFVLFSG